MPIPQNGQTHSNNSPAFGDELFECVWPFCGVGAWKVNGNSEGHERNPIGDVDIVFAVFVI